MTFFRHTALFTSNGTAMSTSILTSGSMTDATANGFWVTAFGALWTQVTTYFGTTTHVNTLVTATMSPTFHQVSKTPASSALAGTAASNINLPLQNSIHVTFTTASAAKGKHGGMDLPNPVIAALAAAPGQNLLAAAVTACATGIQNMRSSLAGNGLSQVLLTRNGFTTIAVTGGYVGNELKTQRRRYSKITPATTPFT